ncbi:MAG: hypothetical protein AAF513_00910 [Pseudomonadota bacterium]
MSKKTFVVLLILLGLLFLGSSVYVGVRVDDGSSDPARLQDGLVENLDGLLGAFATRMPATQIAQGRCNNKPVNVAFTLAGTGRNPASCKVNLPRDSEHDYRKVAVKLVGSQDIALVVAAEYEESDLPRRENGDCATRVAARRYVLVIDRSKTINADYTCYQQVETEAEFSILEGGGRIDLELKCGACNNNQRTSVRLQFG